MTIYLTWLRRCALDAQGSLTGMVRFNLVPVQYTQRRRTTLCYYVASSCGSLVMAMSWVYELNWWLCHLMELIQISCLKNKTKKQGKLFRLFKPFHCKLGWQSPLYVSVITVPWIHIQEVWSDLFCPVLTAISECYSHVWCVSNV